MDSVPADLKQVPKGIASSELPVFTRHSSGPRTQIDGPVLRGTWQVVQLLSEINSEIQPVTWDHLASLRTSEGDETPKCCLFLLPAEFCAFSG